jgi:glycerophosphoryl diester phosphodiesterase
VLVWRPPGLGLNIEVKTQGDPRGGRAYIRPLLTLLEGTPSRRLLVSSFDDRFLAQLHRASLRTPIGCLYVPARDRGRGPAGLARATGAHVFICSAGQARPALVRAAQEGGLRVFVYGVNTAAVARSVRALGAAGVITDVPARLQRMLNRSGRSL